MPRFAANLTMLFNEVPFLDRFERAAQCGFEAVEFLFPYAWQPGEIKERLDRHRLQLVLHNLPAGDWYAGDRGIACDPTRTGEFREGVQLAMRYATALGVRQLNCLIGKAPVGVPPQALRETVVGNVAHAAEVLARSDLRLLIEPINAFDIPGFWLNRTSDALSIMDEVGAPNLFLQYDAYHAQRTEGELAATIEKHLPRIAHIQVADNPGRHEPGTGEIDHAFLFAHLDRLAYQGWVGCEYKPAGATEAGLVWRERLAPQAARRS